MGMVAVLQQAKNFPRAYPGCQSAEPYELVCAHVLRASASIAKITEVHTRQRWALEPLHGSYAEEPQTSISANWIPRRRI